MTPMAGKAHAGTFGNASNNNNQALGLSYDAAGNVTNYLNAYVYDTENRIQSATSTIYTAACPEVAAEGTPTASACSNQTPAAHQSNVIG